MLPVSTTGPSAAEATAEVMSKAPVTAAERGIRAERGEGFTEIVMVWVIFVAVYMNCLTI